MRVWRYFIFFILEIGFLFANPDNWKLRISAIYSNSVSDSFNYVGVNEQATDGYDGSPWDIYNLTPFSDTYLNIYITHGDWGEYNGNYASDIRGDKNDIQKWDGIIDGNNIDPSIKLIFIIDNPNPNWDINFILSQDTTFQIIDTASSYFEFDIFPYYFNIQANKTTTRINNLLSPKSFQLQQNYPNPFNPTTTIIYGLPKSSHVDIRIYDLLGREITTLVNDNQEAKHYKVIWDAKDRSGNSVPSGMYLYRIVAKSGDRTFVKTRKLLLMR